MVVLPCKVAVSLLICGKVTFNTVSVKTYFKHALLRSTWSVAAPKNWRDVPILKLLTVRRQTRNNQVGYAGGNRIVCVNNRIYNNLLEKVSVVSPWLVFSWQANTFSFFKWAIILNLKASIVNSSCPFVMKNTAQNATSVEKGANKIILIVLYLADTHSDTHLLSVWSTIQVYYWYI